MSIDKLNARLKSFSDAEDKFDFRLANENIDIPTEVIPTGSHLLDDALSCGGWPKGRLVQFYGPSGSGKSLMAMIAIKNAQREDPEAYQVFIDAEQTFDAMWAAILGIDISRIQIIDGDMAVNGRKCFEMLLGVPKEDAKHVLKGKSKKGLLDDIIDKEVNVNLIVLDSLGAIIPPGEDTSAVGKMNMSLMARFLSTTFKKLSLEVNKANIPFIVINHKRDSFDPYKGDHTSAGGNTYFHMLSANVYFEAVMRKDAMIVDEAGNKVGHRMRATVEKSKFGPWPRKCEFNVNFNIGIVDEFEEIAQLAIEYAVIEQLSSVSYKYEDHKWVGMPKLLASLQEDQELVDELLNKIKKAQNNKFEEIRLSHEEKVRQNAQSLSVKKTKSKKQKDSDSSQNEEDERSASLPDNNDL